MSTRRPLTTTAVAAGIGTVVALTLGPIASAATTEAGHREHARPAAAAGHPNGGGSSAGRAVALADTGAASTTPYAVGGAGFLVAGVGLLLAGRRLAS